jgi:colicin import membrane protein
MTGRWLAFALAIAVHVVFIAVLIVSVRWQNRPPTPVTAELYAPAPKATPVEEPAPQPKAPPPLP